MGDMTLTDIKQACHDKDDVCLCQFLSTVTFISSPRLSNYSFANFKVCLAIIISTIGLLFLTNSGNEH